MIASSARRRPARPGVSASARAQWKQTYERTTYDRLPWFDPGPSRSIQIAVREKFLPPGGDVLDVGCGAGSNVIYLAQQKYRAHGIDLSPGAVAAARTRASAARVTADIQEGDALALRFATGSLDGVIDHGCFHTLPFRRRPEYAREIRRVLRPGGSFVLTWVAREHTAALGPRHRPSLEEVTAVFESMFLFTRTEFFPTSDENGLAAYAAFLTRRTKPQPPRM